MAWYDFATDAYDKVMGNEKSTANNTTIEQPKTQPEEKTGNSWLDSLSDVTSNMLETYKQYSDNAYESELKKQELQDPIKSGSTPQNFTSTPLINSNMMMYVIVGFAGLIALGVLLRK